MKNTHHHRIEIKIRDVNQLFNSMDPSPFHEKDLDHDAEEFITSWVQEFPRHDPVELVVHLQQVPEGQDAKAVITEAVHHFYDYRTKLSQLEFRRLLKRGRWSLMIGLSFLGLCLLGVEMIGRQQSGTWPDFLRESLTIAGWVAMWRPLEIYLYEWWPLRRTGQIYRKMSHMPVEVKIKPPNADLLRAAADVAIGQVAPPRVDVDR